MPTREFLFSSCPELEFLNGHQGREAVSVEGGGGRERRNGSIRRHAQGTREMKCPVRTDCASGTHCAPALGTKTRPALWGVGLVWVVS